MNPPIALVSSLSGKKPSQEAQAVIDHAWRTTMPGEIIAERPDATLVVFPCHEDTSWLVYYADGIDEELALFDDNGEALTWAHALARELGLPSCS